MTPILIGSFFALMSMLDSGLGSWTHDEKLWRNHGSSEGSSPTYWGLFFSGSHSAVVFTSVNPCSDRYKRCWMVHYSQLESKTSQILSKCMTSTPLVFPFSLNFCLFRSLVTTSIAPSLMAIGELNIHLAIYRLYLCAVH